MEKYYNKRSVFAFGFETRIKTILPLINRLTNEPVLIAVTTFQSDAASGPSLVSDKHVPACRFQSVSPGAGALVWFSCSRGDREWCTVMSCCSNSCCETSVKLLVTFTFQCTTCAKQQATKTQDSRLYTRHVASNSPDLSSVDYRIWTVIRECIYQKQQGKSNIVDELCSFIFHKVG